MKLNMHNNLDESAGAATGVAVWVITHIWSFPMLQVPQHPIASEILISCIRMMFGIATAVAAYLIIHWLKKNVTHEVSSTKKHNKQH